MRYYKNLDVYTGAESSEVRYNFETGKATIYARNKDDIKRGIANLKARGIHLGEAEPGEAAAAFEKGIINA